MTPTHNRPCDPELASRFRDKALNVAETAAMKAHMETCAACSGWVEGDAILARTGAASVGRAAAAVDFGRLEKRILHRIRTSGKEGKRIGSPGGVFSRWVLPAMGSVALLAFLVVAPGRWTGADAEPSAIVESFSGDVSRVVILETPVGRQTVIWFKEMPEETEPRGNNPAPF